MRRGVTPRGLVAATLCAVLFLPFGFWSFGIQPPGVAKTMMMPPSIVSIRSMSELAVTKVHVCDVIEGSNAHYRGRWTLHGDCLWGVDLSNATYLQAHTDTREAVLRLPSPRLISSAVDHERSEEISMKAVGWTRGWLSSPQSLRATVWKEAARKVQKLGEEPAHMEQAKAQAERVLRELFRGVGWNVNFEWKG